jgi:hypothetical protein
MRKGVNDAAPSSSRKKKQSGTLTKTASFVSSQTVLAVFAQHTKTRTRTMHFDDLMIIVFNVNKRMFT